MTEHPFHPPLFWRKLLPAVARNATRKYWSDLKKRLLDEGSEVSDKIVQLKLPAPDGKQRQTDCFSTENLLRTIQSIPSPKAEPFKLWLAKVGYERIEETEDPELAFDRAMQMYLRKGSIPKSGSTSA